MAGTAQEPTPIGTSTTGASTRRVSAPMHPRRQRSRAAALEAAGELLVGGGLSAVTVDGVSERSGVAKTTLYRHWLTRTDLVKDAFWRVALPPREVSREGALEDRLIGPLTRLNDLFVTRSVLQALNEAVLRDPDLAGFREEYVAAQLHELRAVLVADGERPAPQVQDDWLLCMAVGTLVARRDLLGVRIGAADLTHVAGLVAAAAAR